jgi:high frequency lysogenization protein
MLAQELARRGRAQPEPLRCALGTILILNQTDPEVALGGVHGVYAGLADLGRNHPDPPAVERLRYTVALIDIQKHLRRNHAVASYLRTELVHLQDESFARDPVCPEAVAAFDRVYTETVSTLTPKIMIRGNQQHLRDDDIVLKVRAVLLAGVRAAYLFHEHGGRKWQLFIGRKKLAEAANRLLETH